MRLGFITGGVVGVALAAILTAGLGFGPDRARAGLNIPPADTSQFVTRSEVSNMSRAMYASPCSAVINTTTPTSTFCSVATDPTSATKRTFAANTLTPGKAFRLDGGGTFTVPTGNLRSADIVIKVGTYSVMSLTTPAAPVGNNEGVDFHAVCVVRSTTTINCTGVFSFVVANATGAPVSFSQTNTFDPTVANVVDVLGDWNGAVSTHITTVTAAVLTALN